MCLFEYNVMQFVCMIIILQWVVVIGQEFVQECLLCGVMIDFGVGVGIDGLVGDVVVFVVYCWLCW